MSSGTVAFPVRGGLRHHTNSPCDRRASQLLSLRFVDACRAEVDRARHAAQGRKNSLADRALAAAQGPNVMNPDGLDDPRDDSVVYDAEASKRAMAAAALDGAGEDAAAGFVNLQARVLFFPRLPSGSRHGSSQQPV